ncbi:PQQ-binding-like beta-propeller repeat protein [Nocardia sp. NPDC050175]|uniref:outer membrane protein assembly factor BamB family protein n=1 Tax=Nocardia sp. NPDC050175 TaxID=3364317 RepID=UPI0037A69D89
MARIPGLRGLIIAATAAVITSAGAVVVLMQPADSTKKITGTAESAPGLAWSVDAAATHGGAKAEFRDPTGGTEYDMSSPGFLDAGDTLVTVLATSNSGMHLQDPKMVGIDAATGAVRWQTPAADLAGCGRTPVDGSLVCFTGPSAAPAAVIGYDIASGKVTRTPTDWNVFALATTADRVYVAEGDVESDDVRVHSGTLADLDANWSRPFAMGTGWDDIDPDVLDVSHGQGLLTLGVQVAGFDLGTGEPTWTSNLGGCSRTAATSTALVVRTDSDCAAHHITGSTVLDRTGQVLASSNNEAAHYLSLDQPTDDTIPVLLADGAHDRRTGNLVWTSPDLITKLSNTNSDNGNATIGTATAIVGDTAILRDSDARTMTGLDMRTGRRLWQIQTERYGTINAWDGQVVIQSDSTGLWAIDPKSGTMTWDIPFRAVDKNPDAITGSGQLTAHHNGRYTYAAAHTMIGLRPIE